MVASLDTQIKPYILKQNMPFMDHYSSNEYLDFPRVAVPSWAKTG